MCIQDYVMRQLGTAMWVIDILALRVGGEKGEDEADTVGCCSLRREHFTFNEDPNSFELELEFLGKDSMLFKQNIDFALHGDLGKRVFQNIKEFCKKKDTDDEVFETLTPTELNKHLQSLMKGLSAKVMTHEIKEIRQTFYNESDFRRFVVSYRYSVPLMHQSHWRKSSLLQKK